MPAVTFYKKLFEDCNSAVAFGAEVERIAQETMIPMGKRGMPRSIFLAEHIIESDDERLGGPHHGIEEVADGYYRVDYEIYKPSYLVYQRKASRADVVRAIDRAANDLDEKYQELGPPDWEPPTRSL